MKLLSRLFGGDADSRRAPQNGDFRQSRWSIRVKLMLIISIIVLAALNVMIFVASSFYFNDQKRKVEENNKRVNQIVSINVRNLITSLTDSLTVAANTLEAYGGSRAMIQKQLFGEEKDLIFLGVYRQAGGGFVVEESIYNDAFLEDRKISRADIAGLITRYEDRFEKSLAGRTTLLNASPGFDTPIIGLSLPYQTGGGDRSILVAFMEMDPFLAAFQVGGIVETFMVGETGMVIAHPDTREVLAGADLSDAPIVKIMQESDLDNNLTRYTDLDGDAYIGAFEKLSFAGVGLISSVKEELAFEQVYRTRRWNMWLMGIVTLAALLFIWFFARGMTRPIQKLTRAAGLIEQGQYEVQLVPESRDEIGMLTHSFNSMSRGLQERENLKTSFGKFVSKEIAEMSLSGDMRLGGERMECAIFFSDIRGFTAMSEKLRPEDVVEFLNEYFSEMVRCVNETHGHVDKFIGDAVMAVWGAPRSHGNNTENAINGALMMREALIEFNRGRGSARKPTINIGAGINTGYVIAGQIGSDEKLEYTVIGDAVNLASRVESLTKHFGVDILVSQHCLDKVKGVYHTVKMDDMRVKGKSKPVQVHAVLGRKDDPNAPRDLNELRALVGIDYNPKAHKGGFEDAKFSKA